jgi:hypothetical protein
MAFRKHVVDGVKDACSHVEEYYKDIRAFYEVVDIRFRLEEYGIQLQSIGHNQLFSNASGYKLVDDSPYPFYLWLPSWIGRFYIDPRFLRPGISIDDCSSADVPHIAFIWTWLGMNDAYVANAAGPECWFGVAEPKAESPRESVWTMADMIWKHFRVETTSNGESDGWLTGELHKNRIGCSISGRWFLRRLPLSDLSSFYQIEKLVIRPLGRKMCQLTEGIKTQEQSMEEFGKFILSK